MHSQLNWEIVKKAYIAYLRNSNLQKFRSKNQEASKIMRNYTKQELFEQGLRKVNQRETSKSWNMSGNASRFKVWIAGKNAEEKEATNVGEWFELMDEQWVHWKIEGDLSIKSDRGKAETRYNEDLIQE